MKTENRGFYIQKYRLLTEKEMQMLGITLPSKDRNDKYDIYRNFVLKYYPKNSSLIEVMVDSSYNDSTYDNRIYTIVVYDSDGNELVPNKSTARDCREEMRQMNLPYGQYETCEPSESFFVKMDKTVPDLYVKVDE
jgi:hypothetical protein